MKNPDRHLTKPKYITKLRRCEVCGTILSGYNTKKRCFLHQNGEIKMRVVR